MFAKAKPPAKEKLFQIVLSVFAWRQGIAKTLRLEKLERAIHYGARIGVLHRPGLRQIAHSRTNRWRKLECFPPFAWRQFFSNGSDSRNDFISARLSNCLNAPEVIATRKDRTGWDFKRPIERKHPARAMWGERNPLANCISSGQLPGPLQRVKIDTGTYGARHSRPSQCHMTAPRQYIEPGGVAVLPGNSARKAISEEFASAAMLPGESRSEKPELAEPLARNSNA